jgi:hypothetical protein
VDRTVALQFRRSTIRMLMISFVGNLVDRTVDLLN